MTAREDLIRRSKVLSERIRQRTDVKTRKLIDDFSGPLDYTARSDLMIGPSAWEHVTRSGSSRDRSLRILNCLSTLKRRSTTVDSRCSRRRRMRAAGAVDVKNWENKSLARSVSRESLSPVQQHAHRFIPAKTAEDA